MPEAHERPPELARPRLRLHLEPVVVPGEGLYLLAEREPLYLAGDVYGDLLPLLDGHTPIEQIFAELSQRHAPHEAFAALARLRARGLLIDGPPESSGLDLAAVAFWEALGADPRRARSALRGAVVSITALGGLSPAKWVAALRALEVEVGTGEAVGLALVLTDDHLHPELPAIDAREREAGRPWLLVRPLGTQPWLGPLFVPARTGCWSCLAQRLRGHRRLEAHVQRKRGGSVFGERSRPASMLPSTYDAAVGLVTTEIAKQLALGRSALEGAVITLDLDTLERRTHPLTRRPQCAACGHPQRPDARTPVRPALRGAAPLAGTGHDGGYRTTSAEDTVARLGRHVSPITGVIGSLQPRFGDGAPTPVYITDHGFSEMETELYFLREGFRKRSGGKGTTKAQAMASALGESIERYCGVFQGDEPRLRASRRELGPAAIHPNACMGYSARQYAEREAWNARGSKVLWVPEPFDDAQVLEWTPLWSLDEDAPRYLPAAYCWYGHASDVEPEPRVAAADSNGCAAGNTLDEAVLQGLLELVERDCVALWWYNRVRRPGVALESFATPYLLELVEHYRGLQRELWAIDITSDLGIPAFAAVSRRVDVPREDVILGFGAHVDARVALVRAMTEVNQSLPSVPGVAEGPKARHRGDNHEAIRWWSTATVGNQPYLRADADRPRRTLADHPLGYGADVSAALADCVERLRAHGLHTLVLDQTRPDVGLPVARVVVPGLRHFWARFAPGRLYDVPVALGWRATPLPEAQLNEHVVYF